MMKWQVYRSLYWANQGLIYAAREIRELSKQPGLPQSKLQQIRATLEETRASMNRLLAEPISQYEADFVSSLEAVLRRLKKANTSVDVERDGSANGGRAALHGREKDPRKN